MFDRTRFSQITYQDIPRDVNYALIPGGLNDNYFRWPLSSSFAHELRHAAPFKLMDAAGLDSYYWRNIVAMEPELSLNNADSHLYLDILAELESRHWRLSSDVEEAVAGVIVYDPFVS